jgi:hypothetical protein
MFNLIAQFQIYVELLLLFISSTFHNLCNLAHFQNSTSLTDQALLIDYSAQNFMTVWHVSNITAFYITIYRPGRRLSSFKLSFNLFRIIPLEDSTSGIIIIVIDLITILSTGLLGNHHMYQIVGRIRFCQRKEPPINPTPRPYLRIM